jgi:hypothetical protein
LVVSFCVIVLRFCLIFNTPPFGEFCEPKAIGYAKFRSRSHDAVIRVYDAAGNVIETHEHAGELKEWWLFSSPNPRSTRAMQDGVCLALLHFFQQLTDFQCGRSNDLDTAPFRLR